MNERASVPAPPKDTAKDSPKESPKERASSKSVADDAVQAPQPVHAASGDAKEPKDVREPKDAKEPKEPKEPKDVGAKSTVAIATLRAVPTPPSSRTLEAGNESRQETGDAGDIRDARDTRVVDEADRVPSIPPLPAAGPWRSYKEIVCQLATRIVDAQKPIRVLQAIRWDNAVEDQFLKRKGRELPKIDAAYYASVDLGFDPQAKAEEFEQLAHDVELGLGEKDGIGDILRKTALEYRDVVRMLGARGTPQFYAYSRKLYGSPKEKFPDGKTTVRDLGHQLYGILTNIDENALGPVQPRTLSSAECAEELNERFKTYFHDDTVRVSADDSILADAAAGNDYVKVRTGAMFSPRDIDILEAHEGWVHVATSLNGQQQPVARWLAKGPPRTVAVQEGLAALLEIFTFRTYPRRARRLNDRVIAVDKAEDGASFLEVFEWFRTEGYEEEECFFNTRRVFRGGVLEGGAPFTKDACYCKGIVLNYAFIRSAIQHNRADLVPLLFLGKVAHEDVPVLAARVNEGVVKPPRYVPPMFRDLNGLAIWMAYSAFFSRLDSEPLAAYYANLFNAV